MNKSRNLLIDILRLAARTATFKENGFLNFSHFPLPKRPVKLLASHHQLDRHTQHQQQYQQQMHHPPEELPSKIKIDAPGSLSQQQQSSEAISSSPAIGHQPASVRATARKSIQIFRQINGLSDDEHVFENRGIQRRTNLELAPSIGNSNNGDRSSNSSHFDDLTPSQPRHTLMSSSSGVDNRAATLAAVASVAPLLSTTVEAGSSDDEAESELISETPLKANSNKGFGETKNPAANRLSRLTITSISAAANPNDNATHRVLNQQRKTSLLGGSHRLKVGLQEENEVLTTWIDEWARTLPWKVPFIPVLSEHYS